MDNPIIQFIIYICLFAIYNANIGIHYIGNEY